MRKIIRILLKHRNMKYTSWIRESSRVETKWQATRQVHFMTLYEPIYQRLKLSLFPNCTIPFDVVIGQIDYQYKKRDTFSIWWSYFTIYGQYKNLRYRIYIQKNQTTLKLYIIHLSLTYNEISLLNLT